MARPWKPLLVAILVLAAGVAVAQDLEPLSSPPAVPDAGPVDETPALWFVELASPPVADGGSLATARAEKAAFRAAAARAGLRLEERYAFDTLFNGLSVVVSQGEIDRLARVAGVKAIWPVVPVRLPETAPSAPDLLTALGLTGADAAGSELGLTGHGVKVAVMDTGIDYHHAAFGGGGLSLPDSEGWTLADGTPATRVVAGWDFVGDAFNADPASASYDPVPVPDPFPDDCGGHGTHVAGIVGASPLGAFEPGGVAPGVTFGAYRVFGCEGSTTGDVMIAAMERALADGMDVLNMSIGSAFQWPQYPTAIAATRLVNRGVVVVASIGNSGTSGLWAAGAPGVGEKVIGVASFDNVNVVLPVFEISPDATQIGFGSATAAPLPPTSGTHPVVRTGTPASAADACNDAQGASPFSPGSLDGSIALVRRGGCTFFEKAYNVQQAGAAGVVLYNNAAGRVSPTVAGAAPITIPVVAITAADGVLMNDRIAAGGLDLTWTDDVGSFPSGTGGLISSFSSFGFAPDLSLKPDLGAPGGYVWSTYPLELGGYASLSGTSMASPHVAGAVALLLEARPRTPSQAVRGLLQSTAVPAAWSGNPGLPLLDGTWRQGAGMIRIDDAVLSTVTVAPAKLSLGESAAGPATVTFTLANGGGSDVTYALSTDKPAVAVRNTFPNHAYSLPAIGVAFSAPSVTVPAGGSATVSATITPPSSPVTSLYGGWIVFTPVPGGQILRVPFGGYVGDYQAIPVLTSGGYGFPWLARVVGTSYVRQPQAGATEPPAYTLADGDVPYFLLHLDHPSRALGVRIQDAASGRSWHDAFREEYLPRNSTATGFFAFPWNGTTVSGSRTYRVPDGTYVAVVTIQKALGSASDVETWTSPPFRIARP